MRSLWSYGTIVKKQRHPTPRIVSVDVLRGETHRVLLPRFYFPGEAFLSVVFYFF